jgi:phospholipid/cholesterol/gamma-HCH transport system substrate-binding protein
MKTTRINTVKLGVFVTSGLVFLILMLYMIGRDQNLFSSNITIRARFGSAGGLVVGNNVRYAGIQVGTVKKVKLINDSIIEVVMLINKKYQPNIHKNAVASITTEGLIGNRIVNITPGSASAPEVEEGDLIWSRNAVDTNEMLETLSVSNRNVLEISEQLKTTVGRINNSAALWNLLNDEGLPNDLKTSAQNIRSATQRANQFISELQTILADLHQGKGTLGTLITDTLLAVKLSKALQEIQQVGEQANRLGQELNKVTQEVHTDVRQGKGTVHALLKDSSMAEMISHSLLNIQQGTSAFNDNMEALKHSFLFRAYFKRIEKQRMQDSLSRKP